ncbi:carbohydrate ABC transporter permease [Paenibacillus sp. GCM10012307]|uniref:Sugar ABC transporter permease n=1 Tax=Paenibacillus roseus TaxID=2798579 RepID=A0A934J9B9_9BACL|nr:sugar ABC transporter permease [Paenibacillus roseus]MBJ6362668.1 sugar ABC transporter permease [Paenibacillus roseus]
MHKLMSNRWTITWLVAPGLTLFLFMVCFPILMSVYYGTTNWTGLGEYQSVGFANYQKVLFDDPIFWRSLWNALLLLLATLLLQHPVAILFAILITRAGRLEKTFRTIFFIPAVISIVVTSKMWVSVFHPSYGVLNKVLEQLGLASLKQDWLGDPSVAIWSLIFVIMWQGFGYALLLYYAGLQGIPKDLYEAAELDGAGKVTLYTRVVVPLLSPMIRVAVIIAVTTCLKQMETVFLMTNGGPGSTTQFLGNYLYKTAFSSSLYGYGNAISVIFVIICLIITVIMNRALKKDVGQF